MLDPSAIKTSSFVSPKTHVVGMIETITAIITHRVVLESFGYSFNN